MSSEPMVQDLVTSSSLREDLRFRPRARLMTTLGLELINSDTVALAELVKNAFDADAQFVLIKITGEVTEDGSIKAETGTIQILDDGHGMDETTINSTWLEPATGFRRQSSRTQRGRRVLGEKGVGRFAAAKLGTSLELISKTRDNNEVELKIDWSIFDNDDKYLDEIKVFLNVTDEGIFGRTGYISEVWKANQKHLDTNDEPSVEQGTLLTIRGLRNSLTSHNIEDMYQSLSRLVSPFQDKHITSEFNIILDLPEQFNFKSGLIERPDILQRSHYKLGVEVDNNGHATALIELKNGEEISISEVLHNQGHTPLRCGPFEMFLNVWDRDRESLKELAADFGNTRMLRDFLDSSAGVSIYRDGFRVLPFGERDDDWLNLDHRRVQNPTYRLSNNQIMGYVLIGRDKNPGLIDQTNRQGLIKGPAFSDLQSAVIQLLQLLEKARYKIRPRQERKMKGGLFDRIDLSELQHAVIRSVPSGSRIPKMVADIQKEIDERFEHIGEVLSRYHRLATLGQLIDGVVHELTQPILAIRQSAKLGAESLDKDSKQNQVSSFKLLAKLNDYFAIIINQSRSANDIVQRIARFGGRRRGRPEKFVLESIIRNVVALLRTDIVSVGAEVRIPNTSHEVSLDKTEIQEVLVNLLTNSIYWLQQVRKDRRIISIEVEKNDDGSLALIVEDSGPGVSKNDRDYIFDPYFTTKPNGVGLGLSIAGEIVKDYYDGDLDLLTPGKLGGARLRATLRKRV